MKRIIFILFIFIIGCQANDMKKDENIVIGSDKVKVSYINFLPKIVDKICLGKNIEKLFKIIEISRRQSPYQLAPESKFGPQRYYKITEEEVKLFEGQLFGWKHISYKGNHEWEKMLSKEHIVIENERLNMYIMYPLDPFFLIASGIHFGKIKEGEGISVSGLKDWIDMRVCMQF